MGDKILILTEREIKEIKHALLYLIECNHGTDGHSRLILIAKLAMHLDFAMRFESKREETGVWTEVFIPDMVRVIK